MLSELDQIVTQLPEPIIVTTELGEVMWANPATAALMEADVDDWVGRNILDAVHPDDVARVINALAAVVDQDSGALLRLRLMTATGAVREIETRGSSMMLGGQPMLVNVLREVADRDEMAVGGGDPDRLRALIDHSPAVLALLDENLCFVAASHALTRLLGHDTYLIRGHRFSDFVTPDTRKLFEQAMTRFEVHAHLTLDLADEHGMVRHFDAHFTDLRADPAVNAVVATLTDISDLKKAERQLRILADIDPLTGALNRRAFTDVVAERLRRTSDVAILYCDLDGFKPINDTYGHRTGDAVLIDFVNRLTDLVRGADVVGRLGGDEFAVALIGDAAAGVGAITRRIGATMTAPMHIEGRDLIVGASIGSALATGEETIDELLAKADADMYQAKRRLGSSRRSERPARR